MKLALVTTTINIPHVLKLYRAFGPDVKFFVVGDKKTPEAAANLCAYDLGADNTYVHFDRQMEWKCAALIGWNTIQKRNLGFLEALKWGADAIVSIDDDNLPLDAAYFDHFIDALDNPFSGICVGDSGAWFDPGVLLSPRASHRGFPYNQVQGGRNAGVVEAKIAVAAGTCLGNPDISATTRMVNHPQVHQVSELLRAGIAVHPQVHTVFNSQNTAVIRELIPAWMMWNNVGRMDDIYASVLAQRIMRERDWHTHFGQPFVWQTRNDHDLVKDLRGEIDGYDGVLRLANFLDNIPLIGSSVIDDCHRIWETLDNTDWVPQQTIATAKAWLADCEQVL